MHGPVHSADRRIWRDGQFGGGARLIPEETAIALEGGGDEHAMEVSLSRLRQSLGRPGLVSTVVKRGYRLDV